MAQIINTNIASLNAQRNLNSSQAATNQALERLSSGLRINSAKDDAAGLAISTRFQSQINGLNVAMRNVGDGVSLAQTAEGALGAMTDSLQRIRELALQSSNGTNSDADRQALNAETQQLIAEISRAGSQTNFNGLNLLDGSFSSVFQVGANSGETISVSIGKLTADTLGVSSKSGVTTTATTSALSAGDLVINGVTIGASRASDDTGSTSNAAASAIAKAAAVNRASSESGVTAIVDANSAAGSAMTAAVTSGTVVVNGTSISVDTTGDATSSRASVVSAINAQSSLTGVTAVDSGDDARGVSLVAADGRNITTSFTGTLTAATTGLKAAGTDTGGYTLVANSGVSEINVSGADLTSAGLSAGTYTAGVATVSSSARYADAQSAAVYSAATDISSLAATNFGQLATAGQTATITSLTVAAGTTLDFSGLPTNAAISGTEDLSGFTSGDYNFATVTAAGSGTTATGDQDLSGALPSFSFTPVEFSVTLNGNTANIVLDQNYASAAAVATAIDDQMEAQFGAGVASAVIDTNLLKFTDLGGGADFTGGAFSFTAGTAGSLETFGLDNTTVVAGVETDNNTLNFDLVIDGDVGNPHSLSLAAGANTAAILVDLSAQLSGTGITATLNADDQLTFTNTNSTGTSSSILLTNITGDDAAAGAAALGITAGSEFGIEGTDGDFTISDGTYTGDITLSGDYSLADGAAATALETALNNGIAAINASMNITASVTANAGTLSVVFAETANTGSTVSVKTLDTAVATRDAAAVFFTGGTATNTGVSAFAADQNLEFTVEDADGNTVAIDINTNIADAAALATEVSSQLTNGGVAAFATVDGNGKLNIVSNVSGVAAEITVSGTNANAQSVLGMAVAAATVNGADGLFGTDALSDGDLVINDVSIGAARASDDTASYVGAASSIKEASGIAIAASINRATGSTGVTATANATSVVGGASTAGTAGESGALTVNGIEVTLTVQANADANRASAVSQINAVAGQTGVIAEDNGSGLTLTAADGRNISLAFDTNGGAEAANFGLGGSNVGEADFTATAATADQVAVTTYSTVSLSSAGSIEVSGGTNGNAALASLGLEQGNFGGGVSGQFLTQVDISTQDGANAALAAVDNALNAVNGARAELGAIQNRFETTISNLAVTSENLSAANSRILDADFASEAAALSRSQILQQAGISILAQANAAPQQVLSLLQ
ncbi:MAG: flagellin [Gammaproteobacteria bacterium]